MRCNTDSILPNKCAKSIGGIKRAFISYGKPYFLTESENSIDYIYYLSTKYPYNELSINNDSMSITTEISVNEEIGNTSYTTNILFKQPDMLTDIISKWGNTEFSLIVQDFQNRYYIVGYDNLCKLSAGNVNSGTQLSDFNGLELTYTTQDIPVRIISSSEEVDELGATSWVNMEDLNSLFLHGIGTDDENFIKVEGTTFWFDTDATRVTEDCSESICTTTIEIPMLNTFDEYVGRSMSISIADNGQNYYATNDIYIEFEKLVPIIEYFKNQGETGVKTIQTKSSTLILKTSEPFEVLQGETIQILNSSDDSPIININIPQLETITSIIMDIDVTLKYNFNNNMCRFVFGLSKTHTVNATYKQ